MNFAWEELARGVHRCRLPFLDVTVGVVCGSTATLLVDTGTTLDEAAAVADDLRALTPRPVTHFVLTHNDFDHILGSGGFPDAAVYCAAAVATTLLSGSAKLRADALCHGAEPTEIDRALAARRVPDHQVDNAAIALGDRTVVITHPGRGHTDHDLIAVVSDAEPRIVFCGDLVEESGDPSIEANSDVAAWPAALEAVLAVGGPQAVYVPGHGAVVDADFVRVQRRWLEARG